MDFLFLNLFSKTEAMCLLIVYTPYLQKKNRIGAW